MRREWARFGSEPLELRFRLLLHLRFALADDLLRRSLDIAQDKGTPLRAPFASRPALGAMDPSADGLVAEARVATQPGCQQTRNSTAHRRDCACQALPQTEAETFGSDGLLAARSTPTLARGDPQPPADQERWAVRSRSGRPFAPTTHVRTKPRMEPVGPRHPHCLERPDPAPFGRLMPPPGRRPRRSRSDLNQESTARSRMRFSTASTSIRLRVLTV